MIIFINIDKIIFINTTVINRRICYTLSFLFKISTLLFLPSYFYLIWLFFFFASTSCHFLVNFLQFSKHLSNKIYSFISSLSFSLTEGDFKKTWIFNCLHWMYVIEWINAYKMHKKKVSCYQTILQKYLNLIVIIVYWSRIHERTFSFRFLGIILRVLRLEVSAHHVYISYQFQPSFAQGEVGDLK
jgi:hypothetical protein